MKKGLPQWFGHIQRMQEDRMTKYIIYNAKLNGSRERPRLIFHDQINYV